LAPFQESTDPNPSSTTSPTATTTPASDPPLGLRLHAATTLAHIYIRAPTGYPSGWSILPLPAHLGQYIYPEYSPPVPIPQILSTARVSSHSRPLAAVLPMSPPEASQAQNSAARQ